MTNAPFVDSDGIPSSLYAQVEELTADKVHALAPYTIIDCTGAPPVLVYSSMNVAWPSPDEMGAAPEPTRNTAKLFEPNVTPAGGGGVTVADAETELVGELLGDAPGDKDAVIEGVAGIAGIRVIPRNAVPVGAFANVVTENVPETYR